MLFIRKSKMKIEITHNDYFKELELIKKQNATEIDMYPWIYMLLQIAKCNKGKTYETVSIRDVHKRFKSAKGQVLYGLSSIPDFIIANTKFDNSNNSKGEIDNIDQIYGCVEIKGLDKELLDVKSIKELKSINFQNKEDAAKGQLLGQLLWYKKVLYTNGIEWQYLEWKPKEDEYNEIKNTVKNRIEWKKTEPFIWYKFIDWNKLTTNIEVRHLVTLKECNEETWDELIDRLTEISWCEQ